MRNNALAFDIVENLANFSRRPLLMIQKRNEVSNRAFKINIVFPKGIVSVNQKGLGIPGMHEASVKWSLQQNYSTNSTRGSTEIIPSRYPVSSSRRMASFPSG